MDSVGGDRPSAESGFVKASIKVTLAKVVGLLLTALSIILVAHRFGVTSETDALFMGRALPLMMATQIARAFSISIVPIISKHMLARDDKAGREMLGVFLVVFPAALFVFVGAFVAFAPWIIDVVAWGLAAESRALATEVTRILAFAVLFLGTAAILESYMNAQRRFFVMELISGLYPLGTILGVLFLSDSMGIIGVPMGTLFGAFLTLVASYVVVFRAFGIRPRLGFLSALPELRRAGRQILPVMWGGGAGQVGNIIARGLATSLGPGQVSVLSYSYRICTAAPFFLGLSLGKVMLPYLSADAGEDEDGRLRKRVAFFLRIMLFLFVPMAILLITLRYPIIELLLGHGAFSLEDVIRTADAVAYFAPGMVIVAVNMVFMRTFYSLEEGHVIFRSATLFLVVYVALSFALMPLMEVEGLALGYSLALGAQILYVFTLLRRRIGGFVDGGLRRFVVIVFLAAVVGAMLVTYVIGAGPTDGFAPALGRIVGGSLLFMLGYFGVLWSMRIPEARVLARAIMRRGRQRSGQED